MQRGSIAGLSQLVCGTERHDNFSYNKIYIFKIWRNIPVLVEQNSSFRWIGNIWNLSFACVGIGQMEKFSKTVGCISNKMAFKSYAFGIFDLSLRDDNLLYSNHNYEENPFAQKININE